MPSFTLFSPPSFVDWISLSIFPRVLYSWPIPFPFPGNLPPLSVSLSLSLPSHPISASYEVWKMIVCRMKWTEFAGVMVWQNEWAFLAIHHHSEATAGLLITSCNYRVSDSVLVARRAEGGVGVWEGGWQWAEGNAGSCSTLKNPRLIDFKWWNIDFCLVQGLAEQAATICRRYNAGHPFPLATISHTDTRKNEEKGERGREINMWLTLLPSFSASCVSHVKSHTHRGTSGISSLLFH